MDARLNRSGDVEACLSIGGITDAPTQAAIRSEWNSLDRLTWCVGVTNLREGVPDAILYGAVGRPALADRMAVCDRPCATPYLVDVLSHERGLAIPDPDEDRELFELVVAGGVHIHFVALIQVPESLEAVEAQRTRVKVGRSFLRFYGGAPITSLSVEVVGEPAQEAATLNGFRRWCDLPPNGQGIACRWIMGITRASSIWCGNHLMEELFSPTPVQIPMGASLRRTLYWASLGLEDAAIAERIYVSVGSMKTYWDRIFDAFQTRWPGFFESGRTKKSQVLAYLADHPEERWPASCVE